VDDWDVVERQLGRRPRGAVAVVERCPFGRPAVIRQSDYLAGGEPFPTTYYLTCPSAVAAVSRLEDGGGVGRYERLVSEDEAARASYREAALQQRSLRRPAAAMADGGASLTLGVGGTARDGAVKCLHAHVAFALAQPGYELGDRMAADAAPLYPEGECCSA
jgi:hypothetical protein